MTVPISRDVSRGIPFPQSSDSRLRTPKNNEAGSHDQNTCKNHQWEAIKPHCMGRKGPSQTDEDVRRFIEAVAWISRNGAPWRELPSRFGKWNTVFKRFRHWVKDGVFRSIFNGLGADIDRECVMIDATVFPVHQSGQGARGGTASQAIGRSRGGVAPKMPGLADAPGSLSGFRPMPGQANGMLAAPELPRACARMHCRGTGHLMRIGSARI